MNDTNTPISRRLDASTRRAESAARTREIILQAFAKNLSEGGTDDISVESVASRAGLATRTVYRHFPNREKLLTEFWKWFTQRLHCSDYPQTEQELIDAPPRVFAMMDQHEDLVRSFLASPISREIRAPVDPLRRRDLGRCLADATRGLPRNEADRAIAIVQTLFSAPVWQVMRDRLGFTGLEAGQAVSWAIGVLLRELRLRRQVSERDHDDTP